jgi:cell wall-associated NlpC family hydrolase
MPEMTVASVVEGIQRARVIDEAENWIGTPFRMNGCVKGAGVDCCRLVLACYRKASLTVQDTLAPYRVAPKPFPDPDSFMYFARDWHLHTNTEDLITTLEEFLNETFEPEAGDLAVFKIGRVYSHAAIVVQWPKVIHALSGRSVEYADALKAPLAGHSVRFFSPWR